MSSIHVNIGVQFAAPREVSLETIPQDRIIGRFKHDFELSEYNFKPRSLFSPFDKLTDTKGFPEMVPFFFRDKFAPMTEDIQWFWFNLMMMAAFGHTSLGDLNATQRTAMLNAWRGVTKGFTAFCNGKGTDTERDFIRGLNKDKGLPGISNLSCGGNTVELISTATVERGGKKYLRAKLLDGRKSPPGTDRVNLKNTPFLISAGVNSTPFGFDRIFSRTGPWRADPMHYLDVFGQRHTPFPMYSLGGKPSIRGYDKQHGYYWVEDWVAADRVEILKPGSPYPIPYYP